MGNRIDHVQTSVIAANEIRTQLEFVVALMNTARKDHKLAVGFNIGQDMKGDYVLAEFNVSQQIVYEKKETK